MVRDYLSIEQVRFGDRLRFEIDASGGIPRARVPRLALQTLVENTVKFAVTPRREHIVDCTLKDGAGAELSVARDRVRELKEKLGI